MPAPPAQPPRSPAPRPHWSLITVADHACELFEPPGAEPGRAAIYLHGVHESWLQESTGLRDAIEAASLPLIAPRTGRSWWLDQIMPAFDRSITPERFVLEQVRAEIEKRFGVSSPGIALIGEGMGGQGKGRGRGR